MLQHVDDPDPLIVELPLFLNFTVVLTKTSGWPPVRFCPWARLDIAFGPELVPQPAVKIAAVNRVAAYRNLLFMGSSL